MTGRACRRGFHACERASERAAPLWREQHPLGGMRGLRG